MTERDRENAEGATRVLVALGGAGAEALVPATLADPVSARFVPLTKGPEALAVSSDTPDSRDRRTAAPAGYRAETAPAVVALSRDGAAFPLGLEAGVMWLGIAGDTDAQAASHGAVALVVGPGIAVPIANTSRVSQTSINLHAWFEYEGSRDVLGQAGQAFGFVFGPSISIGDVGTNF